MVIIMCQRILKKSLLPIKDHNLVHLAGRIVARLIAPQQTELIVRGPSSMQDPLPPDIVTPGNPPSHRGVLLDDPQHLLSQLRSPPLISIHEEQPLVLRELQPVVALHGPILKGMLNHPGPVLPRDFHRPIIAE